MELKKGYYVADCIDGITYIGTIEDDNRDIVSLRFFFDNLNNIDIDENMICYIDFGDEEIFDKLYESYGVYF